MFLRRFINKASAVGGVGGGQEGWRVRGGKGGVLAGLPPLRPICPGRTLQPKRKKVEMVIRRAFFALCGTRRHALLVGRSGSQIAAGG